MKDLASLLDISVKTVETHRQRIMEKLDLYNIALLTKTLSKRAQRLMNFKISKNY